jgi:hypothetical protein
VSVELNRNGAKNAKFKLVEILVFLCVVFANVAALRLVFRRRDWPRESQRAPGRWGGMPALPLLVAAAVAASLLAAPRLAAAGGCSGPTVSIVDLGPPRAPLPASGNWDASTLEALDAWRAALEAALGQHATAGFVPLGRAATAAERKALAALLRGGVKASVPRALRDLRAEPAPKKAGRRIDTIIVVDVPRDLVKPTTVAVIALHERRVAALLHGSEVAMTPSLVPALVELAAASRCSI